MFFGSAVIISDRVKELAHLIGTPRSADAASASVALSFAFTAHHAAAASPAPALASTSGAPARQKSIRLERVPVALRRAKRFMLLDFRHVTGLDATAASLFKTLFTALSQRSITLVLTGIEATGQARRGGVPSRHTL